MNKSRIQTPTLAHKLIDGHTVTFYNLVTGEHPSNTKEYLHKFQTMNKTNLLHTVEQHRAASNAAACMYSTPASPRI
jgi:hypothetical protein